MGKKSREEQLKNLSVSPNRNPFGLGFIVVVVLVIAFVAAIAGLIFLSSNNEKSTVSELGEFIAAPVAPNDRLHIEKGKEHIAYTSNPPTSGPHYNGTVNAVGIGPIECKTYTEEVEDEAVLHNLEHGVVWVSYKDKNDKDLAAKLSAITEDFTKVVLSPRAANDSKIALASWTRLLKLDSFDEQKIRDFIKLYRSSKEAPEPLASCGTVDQGK